MRKVVNGGSYIKKYKEDYIVKALTAIKNGMSQRAANVYQVRRATLQFRSSQKFNNKTSHEPKPILTSEEDTLRKLDFNLP